MNRIASVAFLIGATLLIQACDRRHADDPARVTISGSLPKIEDPNAGGLSAGTMLLLSATAQGLVRYDGAGQIEAGLAMRWAISEDGLYYTFRLKPIEGVDAEFVAKKLRLIIASRSENRLRPLLGAIDEIVAVTPEVVEIRLIAPRPNLLDLLAQPDMAVLGPKGGYGPFVVDASSAHTITLLPDGSEMPDEATRADRERKQVTLSSRRMALAVALFREGKTDLVLDGRYTDAPLLTAAQIRRRDMRFDPVSGLFGFRIANRTGFLSENENRRALSMAVDRSRFLDIFAIPDWQVAKTIVPLDTTDLPQPIRPAWADVSQAARQQAAAGAVAVWQDRNPDTEAQVRVFLPDGPGSKLLFAAVKADWAAIGVDTVRVTTEKEADLVLVDEVAPSQSATWYLRTFSCERSVVCSAQVDEALNTARNTPDSAERTAQIEKADTRLAEMTPFIPIAQPLRWSLVAPRLTGFQTNNRGVHPLNHLLASSE